MTQQQNLTIHFGVLPVHLGDVVPGVDGIQTLTNGDRWHAWGDMPREGRYDAPLAEQPIHIQVHTDDAWPLITRIMSVWGPYLVSGNYNSDGWGRALLISVTNRWDTDESNYKGMFALYQGTDEILNESYLADLNRNQGTAPEESDEPTYGLDDF